MPRIPQHFLDCSIYLYDCRESAEEGENFGGSGCLVHYESEPIYNLALRGTQSYVKDALYFPPHIYAVTNKHVIEQGYPVIRLNTIDDRWDVLELEADEWIEHPEGDDLVVAPIELPHGKHSYFSVSRGLFLHRDSLSSIGAGDDTFMVGRFVSHEGKQKNTPSLRFGTIAMLPFEKVRLPDGYLQEAFLVETRSLSGYSGSPVFVYYPVEETMMVQPNYYAAEYIESTTKSITSLVGQPVLLGIDCGHVRDFSELLNAEGKPHGYGWKVESNTGMAIVIPAWRLRDFLETDRRLIMQRKQKDEEYKEKKEAEKQKSSVAFDIAKPSDFTAETYQDVLKRASRKISLSNEEKK